LGDIPKGVSPKAFSLDRAMLGCAACFAARCFFDDRKGGSQVRAVFSRDRSFFAVRSLEREACSKKYEKTPKTPTARPRSCGKILKNQISYCKREKKTV